MGPRLNFISYLYARDMLSSNLKWKGIKFLKGTYFFVLLNKIKFLSMVINKITLLTEKKIIRSAHSFEPIQNVTVITKLVKYSW